MILLVLFAVLLFRKQEPWTPGMVATLVALAAVCDLLTFAFTHHFWNPLHPGAPDWHDPHPVTPYHAPTNWGG